jgi:hypothetical protein
VVGYGGTLAEAFCVHLKDCGVMNEAVDRGDGHGLVWKDFVPATEGLVGGDGDCGFRKFPDSDYGNSRTRVSVNTGQGFQ